MSWRCSDELFSLLCLRIIANRPCSSVSSNAAQSRSIATNRLDGSTASASASNSFDRYQKEPDLITSVIALGPEELRANWQTVCFCYFFLANCICIRGNPRRLLSQDILITFHRRNKHRSRAPRRRQILEKHLFLLYAESNSLHSFGSFV